MKSNIKETTQYVTAIATLFTGIVLCYLSFFLNDYKIADSVLMYFGQTLIFCGSVFGINIYINTKVTESENRSRDEINKKLG